MTFQTSSSNNGEGDVEGLVERLKLLVGFHERNAAAASVSAPAATWAGIAKDLQQAASAISKLKGERDYLLGRWKAAEELACAALHATTGADGETLSYWSPDANPDELRECAYDYRATFDPERRFEPTASEARAQAAEQEIGELREGLRVMVEANDAAVTAMMECDTEEAALEIAAARGEAFSPLIEQARALLSRGWSES